MSTANEEALAAGSRGCCRGSDEGTANTPTTHKMTEENAMTTVENPKTLRDVLNEVIGERAVSLTEDNICQIEACVPWQDLPADTTHRFVENLLESLLEEQLVADLTSHLPVPVWATRAPENFHRDEDGALRRFHDISTVDVPTTGTGFGSGSVGVVTTGIETVGQPDEFNVLLMSDGGEYLTPGEARALAANLLLAADEADSLDLAQ